MVGPNNMSLVELHEINLVSRHNMTNASLQGTKMNIRIHKHLDV